MKIRSGFVSNSSSSSFVVSKEIPLEKIIEDFERVFIEHYTGEDVSEYLERKHTKNYVIILIGSMYEATIMIDDEKEYWIGTDWNIDWMAKIDYLVHAQEW